MDKIYMQAVQSMTGARRPIGILTRRTPFYGGT